MESIISIKGLTMSYGTKEVLKGIDLEINKGEIVGYIGPNGAGKSTTVKILLGIINSYGGKVEMFGKDIRTQGIGYKKRIGYIPEIAEIYENLTAHEYITFIAELYGVEYAVADARARKLMDLFGILQSYHVRMSSYSKGMKQKVLIISSLLHNPDILIFDEPLSGLDANSVMVFKELLSELAAQGKTVLYSSHIMDVVEKISSRIVLIDQGKVMANGSFNELKQKSKEGSLEEIFNQITGFSNYMDIAKEFMVTIKGNSTEVM